jgi:MoaA/NifB/PqqE/SkfB family radical SAM enzyme
MHIDGRLFLKIAEEVGKHNAVLRITGGGEPMLHPRALSLIGEACDLGARVSLITNGGAMNQEDVAVMIADGLHAIEFSIDAGTEDEYAKVRTGLNWRNIHELVSETKMLRDYSDAKTKIIISVINQKGVDIKRAEEHWKPYCDVVQVRKYLTWGLNDPENSADAEPYLPPTERIPCPWLFERINIDTRGDVTYCGEDIAFSHKFANVNERSIADIWTGPEMTAARQSHISGQGDLLPMCAQCPDLKFRSWTHNYWKMTGEQPCEY